jgi:hypothetical protein
MLDDVARQEPSDGNRHVEARDATARQGKRVDDHHPRAVIDEPVSGGQTREARAEHEDPHQ